MLIYLDELDVGTFLHHNFLCGHFRTAALKYCWISGVRRVLKLIVCPLSWLPSDKLRLRFRSRFLFLFLPEPGWRWGLGAPGSDSWGLLPTDGNWSAPVKERMMNMEDLL